MLRFMGSQRVGHNSATELNNYLPTMLPRKAIAKQWEISTRGVG